MSELAIPTTTPLEAPPPQYATDPTGGRLVAWAEGLAAAHRIGTALCRTAFVPKHFAGKPEEAAAAILFGDEIGLSPTQALRGIYLISGTPALYARTMVALVQSRGHDVWTEIDTPTKVVVRGQRRGTNRVETSEWTTDRARKAGYTSNRKYETDPQAMLYARAASDVCRKVAADALAGLAYTVEEMELEQETPAPVITLQREPTAKRTVRRAQVEAAESVPEPEPPAEQPPTEPTPITPAQMKKLHALLSEQGLGDRALGLAHLTDLLGREVETSKSLTKDEATVVIDTMSAAPAKVEEPSFDDEAWLGGETA